MNASRAWVSVCVLVGLLATTAGAVTIDTVPVGNPGNTGELSGASVPGGDGLNRICGAVAYTYNIGKYEVTAGQYRDFLNAVAKSDPYGLYEARMDSSSAGCQITRNGTVGNYTYDFSGRPSGTEADWVDRPVNYVSWGNAARFSNWLHNGQPTGTLTGNPAQDAGLTEDGAYLLNGATTDAALIAVNREADWKWAITSEDEWYKAAYHKNDGTTGNYFDYPTSNDSVPSNALDGGGNNTTYYDFHGTGNGDYTIGYPYNRTEMGAHVNSESPCDTFDQGGNVFEWNEAVIASSRGVRGGGFSSSVYYSHAADRDHYHPPSNAYFDNGFRVSQIPEPATIVLLALGGVGVFGRRRG